MYTKTDFVKWKLEGPKHWPLNGNGYVYIGVYNTCGHELFVNFANATILCSNPNNVNGALHLMAEMFNPEHRNSEWDAVRNLYEAYQKCRQQPTS